MYKNKSLFTMGCDPELFCMDRYTHLIAVQPYVEGSKKNPQLLPSGGTVMRDNVAIEFGTVPQLTEENFIRHMGHVITDVVDLCEDQNILILPLASAMFPEKELTHDECKEFGCEPDYNAWLDAMNEISEDAAEGAFRSCGGHIHIGYLKGSGLRLLKTLEGKTLVIKGMDLTCGLVSAVLDSNQPAIDRRKLYGKAGCYRKTDYGCEYRTLSNFWIKTPHHVSLMYRLTDITLDMAKRGVLEDKISKVGGGALIRYVIDNGDSARAVDMLTEVILPEMDEDTLNLLNMVSNIPSTENKARINNDFYRTWEV